MNKRQLLNLNQPLTQSRTRLKAAPFHPINVGADAKKGEVFRESKDRRDYRIPDLKKSLFAYLCVLASSRGPFLLVASL